MSNKFKDLVIPEGWALVPSRFEVSGDVMSEICQMVASGGHSIEHFDKATFCVKSIQDDETGEMVHGLHLFNSECPEEGGSTVFEFEPLAVEPETAKLGAAFRLAAQIAGIKDEVADFMAGLDGAIMAGKSIEALHDEIMERIALYDTPEAVDLFMQMVKGRSGVELPELVKEIIHCQHAWPQKWIFTVETKDYAPFKFVSPDIGVAFAEFTSEQAWLASTNGRTEIPIDEMERYENITGRAFVASNGFKVSWYSADAIAEVMGNTKASNPLSGKYISANATVIDACQMPADGSLSGFTEWSDKVGFTEYNKMRLSSEGKTLEVSPGDWVVAYLNAEPGRMVFNSFEPEIFEALYTSAAEFLK